jgi:C4-dicarboxylate transporter DctM subunit
MMIVLILLIFFALLFIGMPIAYVIGLVSIAMLLFGGVSLEIVIQRMFAGVDSFSYLALPLFILAGNIMGKGGLTRRLMALSSAIVGRFTGGTAITTVVTTALFGAVSGSTVATTYAVGSVLVPRLQEEKYSNSFIASIIGPAGVLGLIIPPSITMVILGITANISIGDLFIAGVIPGILLTVALSVYVAVIARKKGYGEISVETPKGKAFWKIAWQAFFPLLTPIFILGSIFSGFATATEAAVIAVAYGFILALVYRELNFRTYREIMVSSAVTSATILIIISAANAFTYVLTANRIPVMISNFFLEYATSPWMFLIIVSTDRPPESDIHADRHPVRHRSCALRDGTDHELCACEHHTACRPVTDCRVQHHGQEDGNRRDAALHPSCIGHRGGDGGNHHLLPATFNIPARTIQVEEGNHDIETKNCRTLHGPARWKGQRHHIQASGCA